MLTTCLTQIFWFGFCNAVSLVAESCLLLAWGYYVLQFELECKKVQRSEGIMVLLYCHFFILTTNISL